MNATSITALVDMLRSASAARFGGSDINVAVAAGGSAAQPAARDPQATHFMDRAMDFAHSSRGGAEQNFFGGFSPSASAGNLDIRISMGMSPAPSPVCSPPPPPPPPSNPTHASTTMQNGQAVFENDNYIITAGHDTTVNITNKKTGATYNASGDPHVSVNGTHAFDFWGTTSLQLDDGTKVTIGTTDAGNGTGMTEAAKLTITNGDYGAEIKGINNNPGSGPLAVQEYAGQGRQLDNAVDDGVELNENAAGNDIVVTDQNGHETKVDQDYINSVDLQKNQGQRSVNTDSFDTLQPMCFGGSGGSPCDWMYASPQFGSNGFGSSGFGSSGLGGGSSTGSGSLGGFGDSPSLGDLGSWMKSIQDVIDSYRQEQDQDPDPPPPPPRPRPPSNSNASNQIYVGVNLPANTSANLNLRVWG